MEGVQNVPSPISEADDVQSRYPFVERDRFHKHPANLDKQKQYNVSFMAVNDLKDWVGCLADTLKP